MVMENELYWNGLCWCKKATLNDANILLYPLGYFKELVRKLNKRINPNKWYPVCYFLQTMLWNMMLHTWNDVWNILYCRKTYFLGNYTTKSVQTLKSSRENLSAHVIYIYIYIPLNFKLWNKLPVHTHFSLHLLWI